MSTSDYAQMWEDFGAIKGTSYLSDKYSLANIVGLVGRAREEEIFRHLALGKEDTFLDIGCASGRQVFRAAAVCSHATGIDIAQSFIDAATAHAEKKGTKNVSFASVQGENLPFADGAFTRVICSEVIEHVPDPAPLLAEVRRVLAPGGIVVFTVPNLNSRGTVWKRLVYGFREPPFTPMTEFSMQKTREHGDSHVHQFTFSRFETLITDSGFRVLSTGGAGYIDGPKIGRIIQITNSLSAMQWLTFGIEKALSRIPLFKKLGRHIVLAATRA